MGTFSTLIKALISLTYLPSSSFLFHSVISMFWACFFSQCCWAPQRVLLSLRKQSQYCWTEHGNVISAMVCWLSADCYGLKKLISSWLLSMLISCSPLTYSSSLRMRGSICSPFHSPYMSLNTFPTFTKLPNVNVRSSLRLLVQLPVMVFLTCSIFLMASMRMANLLLTPNMQELKQKCDSPMYSRPKKMMAVDRQEQLQSWQMVQGSSLKNQQMISPEVFYFFFIIQLYMYEAPVTDHYSQQLNEEYKIWKKHVPFLYDLLLTHQLPTNSNSVQFTDPASCLIGTNAVDRNALLFLKLPTPQPETLCDMTQYKNDCQPGELGLRKIQVQTALPQNSEVMRLRVGTNGWVASKTGGADPELNVYRNQHGWKHLAKLDGHTAEGFGLDWNARNQTMLVSGSLDRKICVWDLEGTTESENTLKPICQYHFHGTGVEDVNWNKINQNMFASCGQDRLIAIWDIKEKKKKPECQKTGHTDQIYTLDFCPSSEMLLLSGGQDGDIHLWDLRNIAKKVHTFAGHTDAVNKVQWCPNNRLMFASASSDRRVIIWDISKCGDERQQEDPAEMVFVHAGHRSRVLDFDWSPTGNIIASTQESNTLQVWRRSPATELEEEQ